QSKDLHRRSSASTTPSKLSNLPPTTSIPTPNLSAPAAVTGPCAAATIRGHIRLTAPQSDPAASKPFRSPSTSPVLVKTTASTGPAASNSPAAHPAPHHRVSYASTLTGTQPLDRNPARNRGTTGGSSRPATSGTGHITFLPNPHLSASTIPSGVATGGTRTLILAGFPHSLAAKDSSRSSESFPRAETVKIPPPEGRGGAGTAARASSKAVMPVLEGREAAERGIGREEVLLNGGDGLRGGADGEGRAPERIPVLEANEPREPTGVVFRGGEGD
ncbi:nuclear pore anchor, partial [Striga asiatica]